MADKDDAKSTEQAPKNDHIPPIEVSGGASGGSKDNSGEGRLGTFANKLMSFATGKRSSSTSPKSSKNKSDKVSDSSKIFSRAKSSSSPSPRKLAKKTIERISKSQGGKDSDEETVNLCEEEVTEYPKMPLAPKEIDLDIANPSPVTESMAEKWVSHNKSSSVSSVPSDYSSLPDDDCDIALDSPDDPPALKDDKQTEE